MFWLKLRYWLCKFFGKTHKATICGHHTKLVRKERVFGEWVIFSAGRKNASYCVICVAKMTIRCAWCRSPIFVNDLIALFTPREEGFVVPEHAVAYCQAPLHLVSCGNCADTIAELNGIWVIPGKVQRIPSLLEKVCLKGEGYLVSIK